MNESREFIVHRSSFIVRQECSWPVSYRRPGGHRCRADCPGHALREAFPPERSRPGWRTAGSGHSGSSRPQGERLLGPRLPVLAPAALGAGPPRLVHREVAPPGQDSFRPDADALYDPSAEPSACRWDLPLPGCDDTLAYLANVLDRVLDRLDVPGHGGGRHLLLPPSIFNEDRHGEVVGLHLNTALSRARLGRPSTDGFAPNKGPHPGDVTVPAAASSFLAPCRVSPLSSTKRRTGWTFLGPFVISRSPVTQAQFAAFVDGGGYWR